MNNGVRGDVAPDRKRRDHTSTRCETGGDLLDGFVPPSGPNGTARIDLRGGEGTSGVGGRGAPLRVVIDGGGTRGGHIRLFRQGSFPPPPKLPTTMLAFGVEKLDVAANMTVQRRSSPDEAQDGEVYTLASSGPVRRWKRR